MNLFQVNNISRYPKKSESPQTTTAPNENPTRHFSRKVRFDEESGAPLLQSTFFGGFYVTLLAATS